MRRWILCVLLLCLLLTACGQNAPQEQLNSGPSLSTSTLPTTALPTGATETTAAPTTVSTANPTTVPTTAVQTTAPTTAKPTTVPTTKRTIVPTTAIPTASAATTAPTTGNTSNLPPKSLLIRSAEEYDCLLQAVKDEQIYHESSRYQLVFRNHDELVAFVKLLEKLPSPQVAGARYMTLRYTPSASLIKVEKVIDNNHFYRFNFYYIDRENAANDSEILSKIEGRLDTEVVLNEQKNVTVIKPLYDFNGIGQYRCVLNMDGWYVRLDIINKDDVDLTKQSLQEVFSVVTVEEKFEWR